MRGMLITTVLVTLGVGVAHGQDRRSAEEWCRDSGWSGDGERACDVREYTVAAPHLDLDATPNGGVRVVGGPRTDTLVRARVVATAATQAEADALLRDVKVATDGGTVRATGPDRSGRRSWHVSYEAWVPGRSDVTAHTQNGGISVSDVSGTVRVDARNGGVTLSRVAGDVRGRTTNGGLTVELAGPRWEGAGLDASTTNGGVTVKVPEGYSCQLAVGTVNGGLRADFPLTVQGRLDRRIEMPLGQGGAPVRVSTVNGGVRLTR